MSSETNDSIFSISDAETQLTSADNAKYSVTSDHENGTNIHSWQPELVQPRVISGLLALALTLVCMFAALGVLMASDQHPKDSWSVQPTVPLAILSAIGAGAIRYAKGCASPVVWWHKALQGATVRELEDQWQAGRGIIGAFSALRHGRWISLATILTTIMIIDGAMLQRASSFALVTVPQNITLQIPLSPEVPFGASGIEANGGIVTTAVAVETFRDFLENGILSAANIGCPYDSICTGTVLGPGMKVQKCEKQTWNITHAMLHNPKAQWGNVGIYGSQIDTEYTNNLTATFTNSVFQVVVGPAWTDDYENITLWNRPASIPKRSNTASSESARGLQDAYVFTAFANWDHVTGGTFVERQCVLRPAILEYDIKVEQSDQISVPSGFSNARFYALANNTAREPQTGITTIDGFTFSLASSWWANATAQLLADAAPDVIWQPDPSSFNEVVDDYYQWNIGINMNFADPFDDVLSSFNEVLFRVGLATADWANITKTIDAGLTANQTIQAFQSTQENIYTSDYRWFAGAAILDILAICVVLPLFWGFWTLPKHLSQNSPFDMALAFNGPLVTGINSAAGSPEVIKRLGNVRIAYGLARTEAVSRSESYTHTDSSDDNTVADMGFRRLGIAEKDAVSKPKTGEVIAV